VQAFIAQQSSAANPALVPGHEDPEAALRYVATRRAAPTSPTDSWLALAAAAAVVVAGGFVVGRGSRRDPAFARAHGGSR
jgi:hypothetical protein